MSGTEDRLEQCSVDKTGRDRAVTGCDRAVFGRQDSARTGECIVGTDLCRVDRTGHSCVGSWADPEGGQGVRTPPPPWNCQIINFCHVEIFRQTPSGNLDPPPP